MSKQTDSSLSVIKPKTMVKKISLLLLFGGAGVGLIIFYLMYVWISTPDLLVLKKRVSIEIKDVDGNLREQSFGPQTPSWVPLVNISKNLIAAVIASEDTSFYSHDGVDLFELRQAIKKDWQEKRWVRGASTITQQVVKNAFLSHEKTINRKVKEIFWAVQLEQHLSKSEILSFYLNMVEWGPGIYGVKRAASFYFSKEPMALSSKESAFMAMLLPSPRKYSRALNKKPLSGWAQQRVDRILYVMNQLKFIDEESYIAAQQETLFGAQELPGEDADTGNTVSNIELRPPEELSESEETE